jgi:predicted RNase H-like nuclease (RuvC/YqgF family)
VSIPDSQEDRLGEVTSLSSNNQDVDQIVENQKPILPASSNTSDVIESKDEIRYQHQIEERDRQLASMEILNKNLHDKINTLHIEADLLHSKLEIAEQKLRGYDECRRAVRKEKDPAKRIFEYELKATDSLQQLQEVRELVKFTKSIASEPEPPVAMYIEQSIDHIDNRSKVTIDSNEGPLPKMPDESRLGTSSKQLLSRVFSTEIDLISAEYVAAHVAKGIDLYKILRAMMAAAIQQWVFESDFPNFNAEDSRLVNAYRKCLAMQESGLSS